MLLIGAGLLIRSFVRLQQVSPGFNPDGVISMRARRQRPPVPQSARPRSRTSGQFGDAHRRGAGRDRCAARSSSLPFTSSVGWGSINVEGWTPQPGQELQVDQRAATADYFRTMEIPLVQGRFFTDFDTLPNAAARWRSSTRSSRSGSGRTAIAIGKHLWNDPKQPMTIVGVVGTVKQYGLDVDGRIVVYRPSAGLLGYQVARTLGRSGGRRRRRSSRAIHESIRPSRCTTSAPCRTG